MPLLLAVIALLTFRDYGLGWDDYTHAQYGDLVLSLYTSGFRDTRALAFVNLYLYGGGFDMAAAAIAKILPFDLFETRRLVGAAVGLIGLIATWRSHAASAGRSRASLRSRCSRPARCTTGTCSSTRRTVPSRPRWRSSCWDWCVLIDEHPRPSVGTLAILGIGFGLSIGSRIMAGFGVVEAVLALALLFVLEARSEGLRNARARFARLALLLIPTAIVWPMRSWDLCGPGASPIRSIRSWPSRPFRTSSRSPGRSCSKANG